MRRKLRHSIENAPLNGFAQCHPYALYLMWNNSWAFEEVSLRYSASVYPVHNCQHNAHASEGIDTKLDDGKISVQ